MTDNPVTPDLVLTDAVVVSMDADRRVWDPGYVAIRGDQIVGVGPMDQAPSAGRRESLAGQLVMPGLVNCHAHHGMSLIRGVFDELELADWSDKALWPAVRGLTEENAYAGTRIALAELLLGGVTTSTTTDWTGPQWRSMDGILAAITDSGARAVFARISQNSPESTPASQVIPADLREDVDAVLSEVARLRSEWATDRVVVTLEPYGVLRCTETMVREFAGFAADHGLPLLMHAASSRGEVEGCQQRYGRSVIEQLDHLGVLRSNLLLAHAVWLSDSDIALLAARDAAVSHNPVANLYYATGMSPLDRILDHGVRTGLGVDTAATNNSQNLWETAKTAMFLTKQRLDDATWGSAELALELATLGGASALGMQDRIGSLEPGKQADLIALDITQPQYVPRQTLISNLVYAGDRNAVRNVFVAGQQLVRDGQLTRWDLADVVDQGQKHATALLQKSGTDELVRNRSQWAMP